MTITAVMGHLLLLCGVLLYLLPMRRWSPLRRWGAMVVCLGIGLARVGELRLAAYPAGVLGNLSITTQILLALAVFKRVTSIDVLPPRDRSFLFAAAGSTGLILYTLSSGLTILDFYSLGFGSGWFMTALAIGVLAVFRYRAGAALVIVLGVLAFDFGLLGSANVWDYLLDPVLVLFSWGWMLNVLLAGLRSSQKRYGSP